MKLPFFFASRYTFSKKSTNAINIITSLSVLGICVGSMALIVIMSVFNGFEGLLGNLIGNFKPDIIVYPTKGKVFTPDSSKIYQLYSLDGVSMISATLKEVALIEYNGKQNIGWIKGVDPSFKGINDLDTCIKDGTYNIQKVDRIQYAIIGATLEYTLDVQLNNMQATPLSVYMPKRSKKALSPMAKPFKKRKLYPAGIYSILQADYDNYIITDLNFVQELTSYKKGEISALEIKIDPSVDPTKVQTSISAIMGDDFFVKNRFEQDEALYKITNLEKWFAFIVFSFTLVLIAFNMVGALWMLVLEKKKDIQILKAIGATDSIIWRVFMSQGVFLSFLGAISGSILAFIFCILQMELGLIKLSGTGQFIIDHYPVEMRLSDFIKVIAVVLMIGFATSLIPAQKAANISSSPSNIG